MKASRIRGAFWLAVAATAMACHSSDVTSPAANPAALTIVSGNGQVGLVGQTLAVPLAVRVASSGGTAVKGISVAFAVTAGTATVSPATAQTDSAGQAKSLVTLGSSPGDVTVTATVSGTSLTTTFAIRAGASTATPACNTSSPQTPTAGSVLPGLSGTGICLSGGTTGADYSLVAFYGDPDSSKVQNLLVTGSGANALSTPDIVPSTTASVSPFAAQQTNTVQAAFDAHLRETARRELTPLVPAARLTYLQRQQHASFATIPANPTIGTLLQLNTQGIFACTQIKSRTARVAAVSNNAIIVADTANPSGGFTDAEYASFAATFDTLINPLDIANFGQPSDIDGNGKIIIFFTKEVNALTPKGTTGGVVGGFFFERDLFPLTTQNGLPGCAGSNLAEMFYMLVPDPTGVYSIPQSKTYVTRVTPETLAHEYQHLINAGRRLYVNTTADFPEDTWLNEGLSHVAEELLFYKTSGLSPRQNLDPHSFTTQTQLDAVNNDQIDNIIRYEIFLGMPSQTSVYAGNDSLETRGATWNLLRYLADHRGSSDGDTWMQLVNSTTTGQKNLAHVFGADYLTQINNWAVSVMADDVAGVTDTKFLQPSWNMRLIYPSLTDGNGHALGKYPLQVFPLSSTSPVSTTVFAGGAAYVRFTVPSGGKASVDWGSLSGLPASPLMSFTIVRTR